MPQIANLQARRDQAVLQVLAPSFPGHKPIGSSSPWVLIRDGWQQ